MNEWIENSMDHLKGDFIIQANNLEWNLIADKIDFDQLIGLRSFFSARNTTCGQSKTIEKITIHLREQSVTFVRGKKVKVCVCVRVLMIDRLFFFLLNVINDTTIIQNLSWIQWLFRIRSLKAKKIKLSTRMRMKQTDTCTLSGIAIHVFVCWKREREKKSSKSLS